MDMERWTRPPQTENAAEMLREMVARIREIDDQARALNRELRELYSEAKGRGISVKALKQIARDPDAQNEAETVAAYLRAMGASDVVVSRLRTESLDNVLFGSTGFPSDGIDLDFDIERDIGGPGL
jgi:uncharacterized protein (UPF0335 family)